MTDLCIPTTCVRPEILDPALITSPATRDFGSDMNQAVTLAGNRGCVDATGVRPSGGQLFMATPIFQGVSSTNLVSIYWPAAHIYTSVIQMTGIRPGGDIGFPSGGASGLETTISLCNLSGGCGPTGGPYDPVVSSPNYVTGGPTILPPYTTGTISCSGTACTGAGFTSANGVVGSSPANCIASSGACAASGALLLVTCNSGCPGGAANGTPIASFIENVNSTTSITLQASVGTVNSGSAYSIYPMNAAIAYCDGCQNPGSSPRFGHFVENMGFDAAGVQNGVGYYSANCQEGCTYIDNRFYGQTDSPVSNGVIGTATISGPTGSCTVIGCVTRTGGGVFSASNVGASIDITTGSGTKTYTVIQYYSSSLVGISGYPGPYTGVPITIGFPTIGGMWDDSFFQSSGNDDFVANNYSLENGVGLSYGLYFEQYQLTNPSLENGNGPHSYTGGTIVGSSPNDILLQAGLTIDGGYGHGQFCGIHFESAINAVEIGPVNAAQNIDVCEIESNNTISNALVEYHSGSSGTARNTFWSAIPKSGKTLVQDDNPGGTKTVTTSTVNMDDYHEVGTTHLGDILAGPLAAPQWNDATYNLPVVIASGVASAVDQITVTDSAMGSPATVTVSATGSDSNVNLNLVSKGTGTVKCNGGGCGLVQSVFGRTGAVVAVSGDYTVAQVTGAAPLASPTFTGTAAAPTPTIPSNNTTVATTAFVNTARLGGSPSSLTCGTGAGIGWACGTGAASTDGGGQINVNTGTGPVLGGVIVTLTLSATHSAVFCSISPTSAAAAAATAEVVTSSVGGNNLTLTNANTALMASTSYGWAYTCSLVN
jgi:hypothetical protein